MPAPVATSEPFLTAYARLKASGLFAEVEQALRVDPGYSIEIAKDRMKLAGRAARRAERLREAA